MNAYAEFVRDHYDEVRKFPTHQRFKELAKMWEASKSTASKTKKSKAKETK